MNFDFIFFLKMSSFHITKLNEESSKNFSNFDKKIIEIELFPNNLEAKFVQKIYENKEGLNQKTTKEVDLKKFMFCNFSLEYQKIKRYSELEKFAIENDDVFNAKFMDAKIKNIIDYINEELIQVVENCGLAKRDEIVVRFNLN